VVIFPDGEDPDSFAKAHTPDEIREYIGNQQEDFIQFKTKLLMEEADRDPVKRAEMVSSIVRTISMLEDNIKQSVYIKAVSKQMEMGEDILYSELQKFRAKNLRDKQKQERRKQIHNRNNLTPAVPAHVTNIIFEEHEKEIITLLLNYGNELLEKDEESGAERSVAHYIINEIHNDALKFENLLYYKLFEQADALIATGKPIDKQHFIQHTDPDVARISAELCTTKYYLHKFWEKRGTFVETAEDNLSEFIPNLIHQYKRKVMQKAQEETNKRIQKAQKNGASQDEIYKLMQEKIKIQKVISLLVENKGIVIMR